jgi:CDP-diacylglycerol--glycerol-3-phosphate 3-phosphatidyltransferase
MRTHKQAWYIINGITLYRVIAAPVLLLLLLTGYYQLFKWLLAVSFFTDLIDGYLARKFKVTSVMGTRLDSIGDDLTVFAAVVGLFIINPSFIKAHKTELIILFIVFVVETAFAFYRYGKMSNFHTYLAKLAAFLQGVFLLVAIVFDEPNPGLYYAAFFITLFQLLEEVVITAILPEWKSDVKGIYWVLKNKKNQV